MMRWIIGSVRRMKTSWILGALGLLASSAALWAADSNNANGTEKSKGRVVILGDSITAGYGLEDPDAAYPAVIQKKVDAASLPFTIVNAGISGDTTSGGLRRVKWALGSGADVLVVALGGNDGLRGISPKQTAENLAAIIDQAREKSPGITILLAGMQMPGNMGADFVKEYQEIFPKVAKEKEAIFIPFLIEGVGGDPKMNQPDQIHPTAEGQQRVAGNVWKLLEPALRARISAPAAPSEGS
jgi:acyl-CoA thioesterase-1